MCFHTVLMECGTAMTRELQTNFEKARSERVHRRNITQVNLNTSLFSKVKVHYISCSFLMFSKYFSLNMYDCMEMKMFYLLNTLKSLFLL